MGKIFGVDRLDWRFIPINWDAIEGNEILAGTPMDKDGNIANNADCFGVLMDDLLRGRNKEGRVVISGCIDVAEAEKHSGVKLSDEAKAVLPNLWSAGGGSGGSGGGGGAFVVTLSGNAASGITADKTYLEIKAAHDAGNFPVFSFRGRQIFQSYFFSGSDFQICSASYMSGTTATLTTIIISSDDTATMNMATFSVTPM